MLRKRGRIKVTTPKPSPPEPTEEQKAFKILQDAEAREVAACTEEINAILKKYGRTINVLHQINLVRIQR